jgi:nitrate reductase NapE
MAALELPVPARSTRARHATEVCMEGDKPVTRAQELRGFLLLSVVMAPVLAVIVVGGYGFLVWMLQLLAGPPGSR